MATVKQNLREADKIALTTDAWTSRATTTYVTFTAHFIHKDWTMTSYVLQTKAMHEAHTGVNMAALLQKVVTEWGMTGKVDAVVTDNASNMTVAVNLAGLHHIKCYAHTTSLASQCALKLPAVAGLLGRVRWVTGFFHQSAAELHVLKEKQQLLGLPVHRLVTDVPTRWNSAFDMVEHFLQQQPAITATLLSTEVRKKEKDVCTFTEEDISNAEEFVEALKPVKVATCVMSDENHPTLSVIAPLHAQLLQMTVAGKGDSPFVKELKKAIHEDLSKRYTSQADKSILNLTSALDLRFKALPFLSDADKQVTLAKLVVEAAGTMRNRDEQEGDGEPVPDGETEETETQTVQDPQCSPHAKQRRESCALAELLGSTFREARQTQASPVMSPLHAAQKEVDEYTTAAPLPRSENPLDWWKVHHCEYPLLAKLAKQYLCIPGTSVSAERVFSTAGGIVTAQRSSLTPEHVDQLLFLHKNLITPKW
ncbi:E3 SUMO-protein ligase ZBED1-like [Neoarius graeffei]|uniref:E3 SUMO-protein ligase ZBED1-like n=1 Tax=Neoarius graeffei TaxID=443677 RepID=UPI00298D28AA|nr:E3 SUMO-protein ligase ZBED1-like [Neoarius graeffei]